MALVLRGSGRRATNFFYGQTIASLGFFGTGRVLNGLGFIGKDNLNGKLDGGEAKLRLTCSRARRLGVGVGWAVAGRGGVIVEGKLNKTEHQCASRVYGGSGRSWIIDRSAYVLRYESAGFSGWLRGGYSKGGRSVGERK